MVREKKKEVGDVMLTWLETRRMKSGLGIWIVGIEALPESWEFGPE
jgi:hypothetical protein